VSAAPDSTGLADDELGSTGLGIDRCFCFGQTFAGLRETAAATGAASVAELQAHTRFGQKCRLCHPYVRRMLRTGETVFADVVTDADEPG
jgi:bacterioferritin-associated ferredoxin